MEGRVGRRLTLSEQMSILDTSNLRDLLKVRDEEDDGGNALAGLTLGAVLGCEDIIINQPNNNNHNQPSRTLLDIIKDEESGAAYRGIIVHDEVINNNNKQKSWKSFKDRLRLRRAGAAWSSSSSSHHHHHPDPVSDDIDFSPTADCRMDISGPTLTGIQRSSFSIVSSGSVPVQNVTDLENNTEEINSASSTSDHVFTVPNNNNNDSVVSQSGPVVMRLSAALAAEREEQRQASSQLQETEITDTQLMEDRESVVEQGLDHQQNQIRNEELGIDQRGVGVGVGVVSIRQEQQQQQQQEQQPLRVSLMALLEETMDHRQNEMILLDDEEDEMEEGGGGEEDQMVMGVMVERERERGVRNEEYICCVCMIRHKGAAFIPCGHTFCRLCSRKLWVNRGNCPLCNGFILEILDIF